MIAVPPLSAEGLKVMVAWPLPAVAWTLVGDEGAVSTGAGITVTVVF